MAATTGLSPSRTASSSGGAVSAPARERGWLDTAYVVVVVAMGLYTLAALTGGLAAVLVEPLGWEDRLFFTSYRTDIVGRRATALLKASSNTQPVHGIVLDYAFSLSNLTMAGVLLWLRARRLTSRLLVIALIGTAAIFNLQAYTVWEAQRSTTPEVAANVAFHAIAGVAYLLALVTFPDGKLVPHWSVRRLTVLYVVAGALIAAPAVALQGTSRTLAIVMVFGLATPLVGVLTQAYRRRRAWTEDERNQARIIFWALVPALLIGLYTLQQGLTSSAFEVYGGRQLDIIPVALFRVFQPTFGIILLALFVGIVRFRLWGIERLVTRTLTYAALAALITVVYIAVVVGVGRLVGANSDNLFLPILATGVVALVFGPARDGMSRLADRLVYGRRASALETLADFAEQAGTELETEAKLQHLAQLLADGTAAGRADVWLRVGDELRRVASAPDPVEDAAVVRLGGDDALPPLPEAAAVVPVRHGGELLGALTLSLPQGETVAPGDRRLLDGLAGQAGLLLRNVRLTAELLERVRQLRASRQRLVVATDEARRKLERDLHDGAQQQLVALRVKLSLAHRMTSQLGPDAERVTSLLADLGAEAEEAVTTLRDLAHGIYPPLLADQGLPAALRSQAGKSSLDVSVETDDSVGRYHQDHEAAVYFCCLEALQNVAKYAEGAERIEVRIREVDGQLRFRVSDDGCGFDPSENKRGAGLVNMTDRLDALGGAVVITSAPGRGCTLEGWVPAVARET